MGYFKVRNMFRRLPPGVGLLVIACTVFPGDLFADAARQSYSFGIVPQQAVSKLAKSWIPFLRRTGELAGVELVFKTAPTIPEFERRMAKGEYDFSYMNPFHYVVFSGEQGYRAIARQQDKVIKGIFVTARDGEVQSLEDLRGKELAFPSPGAFAASILTQGFLKKEKIDFQPVYVGSHDSVYLNVASGRFVAGGGIVRTLNVAPEAVKQQLRILWTSPGYTPHAFAVHERVPPDTVSAVRAALIELSSDRDGPGLLQPLGFTSGLVAAEDGDWDDVRGLGISPRAVIADIIKAD